MSLVYPYFRFITDRENHKAVLYYFSGPSNVGFTLAHPSAHDWEDMGKSGKAQAKEPELVISNAPPLQQHPSGEGLGKLYVPQFKNLKRNTRCTLCFRIFFLVVAIITALQSIAVIAVAVTSALATKIYSNELSGRLVAMVVLAVTAAVTISVTIYAVIGAVRKQRRPVHAATVVLVVVVIIQAIILAVSVNVTTEDEVKLSRSLSESFKLARDDNPRHVKMWAMTQHDLSCCGVYSAEDYRAPNFPTYFAANVPISCCPSYDPDRSELVQERERESCKAKKEYHDIGCRNVVIDVFKETSHSVMVVAVMVIILEVLCILIGSILVMLGKDKNKTNNLEEAAPEVTVRKGKGKS